MKNLIFIFFIFLNSNLFAQKFFTVSMFPLLPLTRDAKIDNNLFFNLAWNPNSFVSNTFYLGVLDGFTYGTSLGFNYIYPYLNKSSWYFSSSLNLPFFMQIKNTKQSYYTGFNFDLAFSFSLNEQRNIYMYLVPISFFILPFNWLASQNESIVFDNKTYFYYSFFIGLRKPF